MKKIKGRSFGVKDRNILKSKKNRLQRLISILLIFQKKSVTLVKLRVSTAIKKITLLATVSSQKTGVSLGNLYTCN